VSVCVIVCVCVCARECMCVCMLMCVYVLTCASAMRVRMHAYYPHHNVFASVAQMLPENTYVGASVGAFFDPVLPNVHLDATLLVAKNQQPILNILTAFIAVRHCRTH